MRCSRNDTLAKIKRLILQGNVRFTGKARLEMWEDHLEETDVFEAMRNSTDIDINCLRRKSLVVVEIV